MDEEPIIFLIIGVLLLGVIATLIYFGVTHDRICTDQKMAMKVTHHDRQVVSYYQKVGNISYPVYKTEEYSVAHFKDGSDKEVPNSTKGEDMVCVKSEWRKKQ